MLMWFLPKSTTHFSTANPSLVEANVCIPPDGFVSMETGPQTEGVACELLKENKSVWSKE